ncbi:MAG: GntR family transcriptional regulator [Holophagales bacterium]|nr:GntR family transcriptional regulator [Holophagales bacterium]
MATISDYIQRDLEARLARGETLPYRLTLASISSFYHVSPMPVRTAVRELVDKRVLFKGPNGRLGLVVDPMLEGVVEEAPEPPKGLEEYEREIADHAVRLSLEGDGPYLREETTAERFGIGRSMVRRIFSRLSGAGALEHVPRCGWRVVPYRERDMEAYIDVREVLEVRALELAHGSLEPDRLEAILGANRPGPGGEPRIDNSLHAYWIEECCNRYIQDWFRLHGPYYESLFDFATVHLEARAGIMASQHRRILEALLASDLETATARLRVHIRDQKPNVGELIASYRRAHRASSLPAQDT